MQTNALFYSFSQENEHKGSPNNRKNRRFLMRFFLSSNEIYTKILYCVSKKMHMKILIFVFMESLDVSFKMT